MSMNDESIAAAINKPANIAPENDVEKSESENEISHCANCGKAGIKLKKCSACHLVSYCGIQCQKEHRPKHKRHCKQRAAELHDEILFTQPASSHLGDCPICLLPLSLDDEANIMHECCSTLFCKGCCWADRRRGVQTHDEYKCPFCRQKMRAAKGYDMVSIRKRAFEHNCPVALQRLGMSYSKKKDYKNTILYWTMAAELNDANACNNLGLMYLDGTVVEKDEKKGVPLLEKAAIAGHCYARFSLGYYEDMMKDRLDRAVKHWLIAAALGHDMAVQMLKLKYDIGDVSKDVYDTALRTYQTAVDATKSLERDEGRMWLRNIPTGDLG